MKKKFTMKFMINLMITFLLTAQMGFAQNGWEEVFTTPDAFMRDICFVPGTNGMWQTGWAISYEGDIYKTTDGGDNWTTITQTLSAALAGISFANETTGYICTLDNKILKSTDGGLNWTSSYAGGVNFDKIAFKDSQNGVASGTEKLYTSDGGTNWTSGTGGSTYWDLDYASNNVYYGVNLGGALGQSTDGGATWTDVEDLGLFAFMTKFLDENNGMFGGDLSKIEVTHDGGSTWTTETLGDGQDAINTGGFFDADTVYACGSSGDVFKTINGGTSWTTDTSFSDFFPRGMVVTQMNEMFIAGRNLASDGVIWRKIGPPPIDADFEADPTSVCAGSTVDFTDLSYGPIDSWTWTFEGGTPASSTEQNPSVTYNTPGEYYVKLVVTVGEYADSLTIINYINVVLLPTQADQPTGEIEICTGTTQVYTTADVQYAEGYDWEVSPSSAGSLSWDMNVATLVVSDSWTGDFTLKVRANNACGDGPWSDDLSGTVYLTPSMFDLVGGGEICEGGPGAEIELMDSEAGIDYELYNNEVPTGNIVAGTGEGISFGLITTEGNYTAYGSSATCSIIMTGEVSVIVSLLPTQLTMPTGTAEVCNNDENDYTTTGAQGTDDVIWSLSPENAGTIISDGMTATISWDNAFEGTASLTVLAENSCGAGPASEPLEILVMASPTPEISGDDLVCKNEVSVYSTSENAGNTYGWEVIGGAITAGEGTSEITVTWGNTPGQAYVIVNESLELGCSAVDSLDVTIDDCTGIENNLVSNDFKVYPNPAQSILNINFSAKIGEKIKISIYNSMGQLLITRHEVASGENQSNIVDISHLSNGIYILKIQTENRLFEPQQFVKK